LNTKNLAPKSGTSLLVAAAILASILVPAGGKKPDPAQPPPEDPPEGVKTFPATTNRSVEGDIEYTRKPPTNGDHAPLWQNCGFYERPIQDENAVHSLDHGAV
jgi:hypothetical protein